MKFAPVNPLAYIRAWLRLPLALKTMQSRLDQVTFELGCVQTRLSENAPFPRGCEFQVFSQAGDDGLIQRLVRTVPIAQRIFVDFGVQY